MLDMLSRDFNSLLIEEASTCTKGVQNATKLADALEINFELQPVSQPYFVGWSDWGANLEKIIFNWTFAINGTISAPIEFSFDILQVYSPITLFLYQN